MWVRLEELGARRACFRAFEGSGIADISRAHPASRQNTKCPSRCQDTNALFIKISEKVLKEFILHRALWGGLLLGGRVG